MSRVRNPSLFYYFLGGSRTDLHKIPLECNTHVKLGVYGTKKMCSFKT